MKFYLPIFKFLYLISVQTHKFQRNFLSIFTIRRQMWYLLVSKCFTWFGRCAMPYNKTFCLIIEMYFSFLIPLSASACILAWCSYWASAKIFLHIFCIFVELGTHLNLFDGWSPWHLPLVMLVHVWVVWA